MPSETRRARASVARSLFMGSFLSWG